MATFSNVEIQYETIIKCSYSISFVTKLQNTFTSFPLKVIFALQFNSSFATARFLGNQKTSPQASMNDEQHNQLLYSDVY